MRNLVVVSFLSETKAHEVRQKLVELEKKYLVSLEDAVVVVRNKEGKIAVNQQYNLVASGAIEGTFFGTLWGLLLGLLFFNPLVGLAAGSVTGAALGGTAGWLSDIGIDDDFIKQLGQTIQPSSSALFLLIKDITPDKVVEELQSLDLEGKVLHTSLSIDDEAKLKELLQAKSDALREVKA
ncbi:DUF1269 domain-containing protein [Candidatus Nitronereus thalassa]|uniref:DUF1269 domain-containing protein n=1 Tax=Candidatus Nitronereus thalassa TaxID=3020898 RepID=A0ABU3KBP2_9BACT|nr:DUF1269 domain-containing protein [Candidatus Nitronereus thalassa]MDT7043727.1 DUF1269 domain-containing protein [Candidatus Nitronereus thalassa]